MNTINSLASLTDKIQERLSKLDKPDPELLNEVQSDLLRIIEKLDAWSEPSAKEKKAIQIWSDGACEGNPGPGGWGTIILKGGEYREFSGFQRHATNNIMEMTGALEGIIRTPPGSSIILTSDSRYLVQGMSQWIKNWKRRNWKKADGNAVLNRELWMELDREAGRRKIEWRWVKGHSNHPQNERCDQLAREAIKNGQKLSR